MPGLAKNLLERIRSGLQKTRENMAVRISRILPSNEDIQQKLEDIEQVLIESDLGVDLAMSALEDMERTIRTRKNISHIDILQELEQFLRKHFLANSRSIKEKDSLVVIIFSGINGTGKTTSLAKIASHLLQKKKKVILAACDTFRAAAIEQISLWGERLEVNVIKNAYGSDAASVAFDAIDSARAKNMDYLLIDTAGRLHNRKELMEELKKIIRICEKKIPRENMEKLFVLDGTAGQNGFLQARAFSEAIGIDGIIVTKLDGTARGGIVIAIEDQLKIPIKFIGVGEEMQDLLPFDPDVFVKAILE